MKTLEQLLRALERPEVEELALVSDRLPCARVGSSFDPVDEAAISADAILAMLMTAGGSRYVDSLGPTPKQWNVRVPGLGNVAASVTQRGQQVIARFILVGRRPAAEVTTASSRRSVRPASQSHRPRSSEAPRSSRPSKSSLRGMKTSGKPSTRPKASESEKRRSLAPDHAKASRAAGEAFRRAPTAPAVPRIRLPESEPPTPRIPSGPLPKAANTLALDTPAPSAPSAAPKAKPHVHVRTASGAFRPEADTQPALAMKLPSTELSALFEQARASLASDLHLVAGRPPLFRIGGELGPKGEVIVAEALERLLMPLIPERLLEDLATQGSCDFALEHPKLGRFRVNVGRQQTGLKACMRLVPREMPTLKSLALPPELARVTAHHQGLVLFTGPTGHGKTTTMTAVVDHINETTGHHIVSVEDPVENVHLKKKAFISQREVGTHTRTFASALRAALREDPDVIVVGELRDVETVRMAVAASETGHLVLGTMNTPSAAKTIDRLIDLFPPADQPQVRLTLAAGLRLIVGQRLVPNPTRTCVHAAVELLPGSIPLSAIIRDAKSFQIPSLQQRGRGVGIVRLDEALADLVRSGRASLGDALPFAEAPTELESLVKGRPAAGPPGLSAPR
jgi:twitching motility protein PilT